MNSVVCVKQVPDTETLIKLNADGTGIETAGIKWIMNPFDEYAVEEAVRQKEKSGGAVTLVCLGPDQALDAIRSGLAMGADTAVHINDAEFAAKADPYATAVALAAAIKDLEYDAIFCGKQAVDDDAGQVASILGELLDLPVITIVIKFELSDDGKTAIVTREIEGGHAVIEVPLPAIFTAQKGLNEPRYASLPQIMKAKKKPVTVKTVADLGVSAEPMTVIKGMELPPERQAGKMIEGADAAAKAAALAKALHEEAEVI
ncbi:MAG: electron transfer flavoprotein subunit beta/FixA family protein [Deltaproteobacteria bacterium]|nr:electron transfer flavoprotein subunit beta/FixA family protein [Deltaproteobacteria bacterium]